MAESSTKQHPGSTKQTRVTVNAAARTPKVIVTAPTLGSAATTDPPSTSPTGSTPPANPSSPAGSTATSLDPSSNGSAPPDVTIPAPPDNWVSSPMKPFRGRYPSKSQVTAAPSVIQDLANFADYSAKLGSAAPPAAEVQGSLSIALDWRSLSAPSADWNDYVRTQDAFAWQPALALLAKVRPLFRIALEADPTLASRYPGLTQFFNLAKYAAQTALTTKKKNKKASAAAAAASAAPSTSTAGAPAPAAARTITVTG